MNSRAALYTVSPSTTISTQRASLHRPLKNCTSLRSKRFCAVREQRTDYRAMNEVSKRAGKGKETLADKPLDFENRPHANRDVMLS